MAEGLAKSLGGKPLFRDLSFTLSPGMKLGGGVTLEYGDASEYGFLALTVRSGKISGEYVGVKPGTMPVGRPVRKMASMSARGLPDLLSASRFGNTPGYRPGSSAASSGWAT